MSAPLRHLWIDLRPMLPGAANGGAKPFILNLLTTLAQRHPEARFSCSLHEAMGGTLPPGVAATNLRVQTGRRRPEGNVQLLVCPFGPPTVPSGGLPVVSIFYDLQVLAYPWFFSAAERRQRLRHLRQLRRQAHCIAAISQFSRAEGLRHGLDPGRTRAIPIQIPTPLWQPSGAPPLGLPPGRFFLYPANLWPHKNHELLFTAFAMARDQGLPDDLTLVCTGDGLGRLDDLRGLAHGLRLDQRLLLPGFVSAATLDALYGHCLAVVFPSLYEGFGMPVIEAMARRLPVCCSHGTALAEVAGDAALLVDPRHPQQIASALLRLANDAELRQRLVQRGALQSRLYLNPPAMADAYWQLFEDARRPVARP